MKRYKTPEQRQFVAHLFESEGIARAIPHPRAPAGSLCAPALCLCTVILKLCSVAQQLFRQKLFLRDFGQTVSWLLDSSSFCSEFKNHPVSFQEAPHFIPILVTQVDTSSVRQTYRGRVNVQTCAKEIRLAHDDMHICTGGDCGYLYIWDLRTAKLRRKLHADRCVVNCVAPHPTLPIMVCQSQGLRETEVGRDRRGGEAARLILERHRVGRDSSA